MPTASAIHVLPSGAPLGAEIVGVDLSQEIDDPTFRAIYAAYNEHTVIWMIRPLGTVAQGGASHHMTNSAEDGQHADIMPPLYRFQDLRFQQSFAGA